MGVVVVVVVVLEIVWIFCGITDTFFPSSSLFVDVVLFLVIQKILMLKHCAHISVINYTHIYIFNLTLPAYTFIPFALYHTGSVDFLHIKTYQLDR